ncbi:MAG: isoprenylcysteine carboxylmethyltransferase family protein [Methanotrichaceae archaeon]|nr:isoprenylcysteine carboxylmethyltransferase family protein [Methanotrichaceae archaeon]
MIESIFVTLLPILFLIVLFGGGERFRRRNIDMEGEPPIDRTLFYISKYSIIVLWGAMVLQSWSMNLSFIPVPGSLKWISLCLWTLGFMLLFIGRFELGSSFRIGSPKENTSLKMDGIFRFTRDPMYLGVYLTLLASVFYTLNPVILLVSIFVIAVHHRIVLAEEEQMKKVFGEEYLDYCHRVRRYI